MIYLYDLDGNLLAEHDATGTMIRDYVWMNEAPVAQIDSGGTKESDLRKHLSR